MKDKDEVECLGFYFPFRETGMGGDSAEYDGCVEGQRRSKSGDGRKENGRSDLGISRQCFSEHMSS